MSPLCWSFGAVGAVQGQAGNTTAAVPAAGWASRGLVKCFKNILQEMGGQGQTLSCFVLFLGLLSLPIQAVGGC